MNEGKKELNIAIVGGGPGCKAILEMFEKEKFRELRANIIGVADVNENAVGYQYAKMKGIPTTTDYRKLYKDNLNLLIELTGSDEVLEEIIHNKPSSVKVIDHVGARLFWDFIQVEEERLRARRELQKKTEEYRHLFESISGYVLVVDRNYHIVQMNKDFERDFGNVIGWHCYSAFKKRTEKCVPCMVGDTFKDGMSHKGECVWTLADGSTGYYIVHSSPIKDERGETHYVIETTIDITEKKRLEEQLVEVHNYTRGLIESSLDALVTFDKNGFITDVNEETVRLTGCSREELVGSKFRDYFTDPDRASEGVRKSFDEGKVTDYELVLKSKTGQETIVSYNATVYKDESGKVKGVFAAARDITEKMRKEADLIQAAKMGTLGQMASGIAHELNQPLSVIKVGSDFFLKMIKRGEKIDDEELRIVAQEVNTQVDRASDIINHLRIFARLSETVKGEMDINAPIRDVFKILGQQLKVHQIEVELDLNENLPSVMADHNRLEQVFINLVLNAMDAMDEKEKKLGKEKIGKVLSIRSYLEDREIVVTVSDTGIGIPEKIMDRLFEPFFTTKQVGKGTGLGLSISYGIVKDYNGAIDVKSEEGIGTTLILRLPAYFTC